MKNLNQPDSRKAQLPRHSFLNANILLSPRWHKLINDLLYNRGRLILAVVSIAIGVFALGWVIGSRTIMLNNIDTQYQDSSPSTASYMLTNFDDGLIDYARKLPTVANVDAVRSFNARLYTPTEIKGGGSTSWRAMEFIAIDDFDEQQLNIPLLIEGVYPPPKNTIAIERSSQRLLNSQIGDALTIETLSGLRRTFTISSIVKDPTAMPGMLTGFATAYISFDTLERIEEPRRFNQLLISLHGNNRDKAYVQAQMQKMREQIELGGWTVTRTIIPLFPGRPRMESIISTIFLIFSLVGVTVVFISTVLIANTMEAIMSQQMKQIGIMRLVGGTIAQVVGLYLSFITLLALTAILIAIPLSTLAARQFSTFILNLNNFDLKYPEIPLWVYASQIAIGLGITWLASIKPILSSTLFTTVRDAVTPSGTDIGADNGFIEQLLTNIRGMAGQVLISIRNIFRKKWRLLLTVGTLGLGGAVFMGVFCIRTSMLGTVYSLHYEYNRNDLAITFSQPHRMEIITPLAMQIDGVTYAEGWSTTTGYFPMPDGSENKNDPIDVIALPPNTPLIRPTILAGRWLADDDDCSIVINKYFFNHLPWVKVGDDIKLTIAGRERTWHIVGQVYGGFNINQSAAVYMSLQNYGKATNTSGKINSLQVVTKQKDAQTITETATRLESHLTHDGYSIKDIKTSTEMLFFIEERAAIITTVLLALSLLLAVVGGINLTNTMSTNVLERTREIGVMRAIGASSKILRRMTVTEGLFIGWFSWLIASILSVPIGKAVTDLIGMAFLGMPFFFTYSFLGLGLWFLIVSIVSLTASLVPAQNAIKITVREAISFE